MRSITLVLVLALALAGCASPLAKKDDDAVKSADTKLPTTPSVPAKNVTKLPDPPVARSQIFETGGALLFQTSFEGSDAVVPLALVQDTAYTFTARESESPGKVATLDVFTWLFNDGVRLTGSTVERNFTKHGVYSFILTVTDSNNRVDDQQVAFGVNPAPVVVKKTAKGMVPVQIDPLLEEENQDVNFVTLKFEVVGELDGAMVTLTQFKAVVVPDNSPTALDLNLRVKNATETFASSRTLSQSETVTALSLPVGPVLVDVLLAQGANANFLLTVETTYQPMNHEVMALLGEGGEHGGH